MPSPGLAGDRPWSCILPSTNHTGPFRADSWPGFPFDFIDFHERRPKSTTCDPHCLPNHTRNHVATLHYQLHCQAPVVEEVDDPLGQLVHRCRRLQKARSEVRQYRLPRHALPLPTISDCHCLDHGLALTPTPNRADDLIPEESETVLLALKRLPPKEAYDRVFRMRRAFQVRQPKCCLSTYTAESDHPTVLPLPPTSAKERADQA